MESKDGVIKFETYRYYKNFKNYRVIGFVAMQTEKGEWVDGVLYVSVTSLHGEGMLARPLTEFKEKFSITNYPYKLNTIKTAFMESKDPVNKISFDGIEYDVNSYTLNKNPSLRTITDNGRLFKVITEKEFMNDPTNWFNTEHMMILEDAGDVGVPGINCISNAKLVLVNSSHGKVSLTTVVEISVAGYGLDFAIDVIMKTYNSLVEKEKEVCIG